jgi:GAF domain-containing protein
MAIPLVSAGELLGVLDVQSMKSAAFTNDDLTVMQVLADLIAVAIENARLFAETQRSLEAMRRAYGDISRQAWLSRLESHPQIAFRSYERGTITITDQIDQHIPISPQMISVPIKVRDTIIGYVDTYKPLDKGFWSEDENELLSAMVDQIGIALEGARLYEASQTQAEKESLVGALGTKLQESLDVDTVLRTAAQEIRQSLGLSEVAVSLFSEIKNENGDGE